MLEKFKHNYQLKILSIIVAFFVWIFVMAEVDPIITRTMDNVVVTNITNQVEIDGKGFVVSPGSKVTTQVTVKGRRSLVTNYITNGPVITGTIESPVLGENQVELMIQRKDNLEVSINPIRSSIVLEEIASTRKVITTRFIGEEAPDYEIYNVSVNPDSTLIEGPKSLVDNVTEIIASIDIEGADKDFTQNVKLEAIDSSGNTVDGVKLQIRYVEATAVVHKVKVVPVKLIITDESEALELGNYSVEPAEIQIKGVESEINNITAINTAPILLEQLNNSDDMQINLDLPEGIRSNIYMVKLRSNTTQAITNAVEFRKDDVAMDGYTDEEQIVIYNSLPDRIKVSIAYSKGLEARLEDATLELYVDSEKSDMESNKFYFGIRSSVPYLRVTINPSVINKINKEGV